MKVYPYWNNSKRLFVEVTCNKRINVFSYGEHYLSDDGFVWTWPYESQTINRPFASKVRPARWYEILLARLTGNA